MECSDCPRFDPDANRCRDDKLNPQRWDQAVDVANMYGARAVCVFNDHRERLVESRFGFPKRSPSSGSGSAR